MARRTMEKKVEALIREDPEAFVKAVLEHPFWLPSIEHNVGYDRFGDDNCGSITVAFSSDGDGRVTVTSTLDPEEMDFCHRFRTWFGGGDSIRTRQAFMILAQAMVLDSAERPLEYKKEMLTRRLEENKRHR